MERDDAAVDERTKKIKNRIEKAIKKDEDSEQVRFKTLPEIEVASCIVKGSYDQLSDATATALSWINSNGYRMSDSPMFCIYHVSPAMTSNPDEYVTEVCFPVE